MAPRMGVLQLLVSSVTAWQVCRSSLFGRVAAADPHGLCAVPLLSLNTAVNDDVIDHAGQS